MEDTTTDRSVRESARIERRKKVIADRYPQLFANLIAEWNSPDSQDCAWLIYSANYLFRTAGIRWAMDPLTMRRRVPEMPALDLSHAFDQLDFVLLTHRHADHLDLDLLRAMACLPILWVIPDFLLSEVQVEIGLPVDQLYVPRLLETFEICGIRILPFSGLHWDVPTVGVRKSHGVPAMGYLVEFGNKRWLFPGDTRSYRSDLLPPFGRLDGLFAHLWLGRGGALLDEPPLLDDFCRFFIDLQPKRVVMTHLEEFGREATDYWDERHARLVASHWKQISPQLQFEVVHMGEKVIL